MSEIFSTDDEDTGEPDEELDGDDLLVDEDVPADDPSASIVVIAPDDAAGWRLDRFVAEYVGSRGAAERAVAAGVLVNGKQRQKSHKLEGGEEIEISPEDETAAPIGPPPPRPRIVWEDEHLAVIDKPPGLVVHPGAGHARGTLVDALAGYVAGGDPERLGIVHRLDRDTTGLMVVARSEEAHQRLSALVRGRELERIYLALVRGTPRSRRGTIEAPIGRDRDEPTRISLDTGTPRDAVTHFTVIRTWPEHALLEVRLETGRTHQIRVHLGAIDLPVVGDPVYGVRDAGLDRQFLHSARLGFTHPFTGERLELEAPLPEPLQAHLDAL